MQAGRPRQFDLDEALDSALKVFWEKGFEGSSLADLTAAMGINRPSLYAAFGDKESLFLKAMQRYVAVNACHVNAALQEPTARKVVEALWRGNVAAAGDPDNPRGCFLVQGALACGDDAEPVRRAMSEQRAAGQALLQERFERAVVEGDLPGDTDPAALARYVTAVTYGLAVQTASGASAADLKSAAAIALRAIPETVDSRRSEHEA
jgi:AcrR family transcriptional regulator